MKTRQSLKKFASVVLVVAACVLALATPGQARGGAGHGVSGHAAQGHHGFARHPGFAGRHRLARHGHGKVFIGVGPSFYWGPAYPYGYPGSVYSPPPPAYWYYCPSAGAYYPNVPSCDEPWLPVPAG
jgi:hypothetical protein